MGNVHLQEGNISWEMKENYSGIKQQNASDPKRGLRHKKNTKKLAMMLFFYKIGTMVIKGQER